MEDLNTSLQARAASGFQIVGGGVKKIFPPPCNLIIFFCLLRPIEIKAFKTLLSEIEASLFGCIVILSRLTNRQGQEFRGGSDEKMRRMWLGQEVVVAGLLPITNLSVVIYDLLIESIGNIYITKFQWMIRIQQVLTNAHLKRLRQNCFIKTLNTQNITEMSLFYWSPVYGPHCVLFTNLSFFIICVF